MLHSGVQAEHSALKSAQSWLKRRSVVVASFLPDPATGQTVCFCGSGWLVDLDGTAFVVTNSHVLEEYFKVIDPSNRELVIFDGQPKNANNGIAKPVMIYRQGRLAGSSGQSYGSRDVAVLELESEGLAYLKKTKIVLKESEFGIARKDSLCVFSGFPAGLQRMTIADKGVAAPNWRELTAIDSTSNREISMKSKAAAQRWHNLDGLYGISGCPLFVWDRVHRKRLLIGMMKGGIPVKVVPKDIKEVDVYAVPIDEIKSFLTDVRLIRAGGKAPDVDVYAFGSLPST